VAEAKFILADIGGYTSFLTDVGLAHGREITENLLNRLVKRIKAWKVANIMGDCVFFYTTRQEPPRETFANIRALYEEFRKGVLDIASYSTCTCGACNRTENLTLKFIASAGEYDYQNIGGRKELIGPDIVRASRLLKNSVPIKEYVLLAPELADVGQSCGLDSTPLHDEYSDVGRIEYTYVDLLPIRRAYEESREFFITRESANLAVEAEIDAPADVVWKAMRDLDKRAVWQVTIEKMAHLQGPENNIGEIHSCVHGSEKIVHATIAMDHENRRKTERVWVSPALVKNSYVTMQAEPLPNGRTQAALYSTFDPGVPVIGPLVKPLFVRMMKSLTNKDMAGLKEFCETGAVAGREPAIIESHA
jgi:hypothetical protein